MCGGAVHHRMVKQKSVCQHDLIFFFGDYLGPLALLAVKREVDGLFIQRWACLSVPTPKRSRMHRDRAREGQKCERSSLCVVHTPRPRRANKKVSLAETGASSNMTFTQIRTKCRAIAKRRRKRREEEEEEEKKAPVRANLSCR